MQVRMVTLAAGPEGIYRPGQVVDVEPERARELVAGGFAVLVDPPGPVPGAQSVETATREGREKAVGRRQRVRRAE